MNNVKTISNLESIKERFDILLDNIDKKIKEVRPRSDIRKTELYKLKNELSNIEKLELHDITRVSEIVSKYLSINDLFTGDIKYNKKDLIKIIERKVENGKLVADRNQPYNDFLFELSTGVRIAKALKGNKAEIHLDGDCDVIVNDTIAIECKYIHELSGIHDAIRAAKKQINTRVSNAEAKYGYIAIDLSNVFLREKINEFVMLAFEKFLKNHECLVEKGHLENDILRNILSDKNFSKVIISYISHEVESLFYGELGFEYELGDNVRAILFQSVITYVFEHKNTATPVSMRGTCYFINQNLDKKLYNETKEYIHSLAVGF
ncbi:TPA: hypothetical protein KET99_000628 [Proteus mirabilis]|nr:hypothetical protein [Proteus mirabilis]